MGKKAQDTSGRKHNRNTPFLSLLSLNRRPNLGLFRPDMASHLREKGVGSFPTLKPPIGN